MIYMKRISCKKSLKRRARNYVPGAANLVWLSLGVLFLSYPNSSLAQSQRHPPGEGDAASQLLGSITGTVVDPSGAALAGARVRLTLQDQSTGQEVLLGDDGQFTFADVVPGSFRLTITAAGFATQVFLGEVHSGQIYVSPQIALSLAIHTDEVAVELPRSEVAEEEIKQEEKQLILGFVPNFYVSYVPNAIPLSSRQKFELAWKTTSVPVNIVVTGAVAGIEQARGAFSGYGQGAQGYGKRYGALYADFVTGTFLGGAMLPSILKQDPRYFYKGSGSMRSRIWYAISRSVVCKSDSGRWQPDYSNILGSFAAGGISNLYYPASGRNGAELASQYAGIRIASTAVSNLLQEFLLRKLTTKFMKHHLVTP
jgi:hypothetical protein